MEVFAAVMSGATLSQNASPFAGTAGGPPRTGQFFFAASPEAFSPDVFGDRIQTLTNSIVSQKGAHLSGSERVLAREGHEENGVEVSVALLEKIQAI